jgi:5-hydroxyisourate hydrolase
MSTLSTHVLDAVFGKPAAGIAVRLAKKTSDGWTILADTVTDIDGRSNKMALTSGSGTYRFTFNVGAYFEQHGRKSIYPEITITFLVDGEQHYHIPLLLSDNSYTTYRGS